MMKNIKKLTAMLFAVCIMACSVFSASAEATDKLIDDADLYSASEEATIESNLETASLITGWDIIIYTNNNGVSQYEIQNYCDNYYIDHNFGKNNDKRGIFLVVDMNSRQMWITTKGETMYYVSDERCDEILDDVQYALSNGSYMKAAVDFIEDSVDFYEDGKPTGENFSNVQKAQNPFLYVILHYGLIIFLVAVAVGVATAFGVKAKYKNNGRENTYDLVSNSRVNLTVSEDRFLTKNVSVTTVSSSGSSGRSGGSRSRSSGGGRRSSSSRGGGGRSF